MSSSNALRRRSSRKRLKGTRWMLAGTVVKTWAKCFIGTRSFSPIKGYTMSPLYTRSWFCIWAAKFLKQFAVTLWKQLFMHPTCFNHSCISGRKLPGPSSCVSRILTTWWGGMSNISWPCIQMPGQTNRICDSTIWDHQFSWGSQSLGCFKSAGVAGMEGRRSTMLKPVSMAALSKTRSVSRKGRRSRRTEPETHACMFLYFDRINGSTILSDIFRMYLVRTMPLENYTVKFPHWAPIALCLGSDCRHFDLQASAATRTTMIRPYLMSVWIGWPKTRSAGMLHTAVKLSPHRRHELIFQFPYYGCMCILARMHICTTCADDMQFIVLIIMFCHHELALKITKNICDHRVGTQLHSTYQTCWHCPGHAVQGSLHQALWCCSFKNCKTEIFAFRSGEELRWGWHCEKVTLIGSILNQRVLRTIDHGVWYITWLHPVSSFSPQVNEGIGSRYYKAGLRLQQPYRSDGGGGTWWIQHNVVGCN